jgi:nucleoside-diphosphate-sugar epimerase
MDNKSKKILIAGHTGFIGKHLLDGLYLNGFKNIIPISRSNGYDLSTVANSFDIDCNIVVNLSGRVGIDSSWKEPKEFYKENYLTTLNLLEIARKSNATFIQISSYVYGEPKYQPIDEHHKVQGYNPYAASKILSEKLCIDYADYYDVPVTIIRPFNLYGINQSNNFLIAQLLEAASNKSNIEVYDLDAKRDYLWAGDLVSGIVKVIEKQNESLNIYNIGSGKSSSAREIVKIISDHFSNFQDYVINNGQKILIQDCICDNSLFSKDYSWQPTTSLKDGISKIIEHVKLD